MPYLSALILKLRKWLLDLLLHKDFYRKDILFFHSVSLYRASLIVQLVKNPPAMKEIRLHSWFGKNRWRMDRLPRPSFLGFPCGSAGKKFACNVGDLSLIPGLGRSPAEGNTTHSIFWPGEFHALYSLWGCKK